MTKQHTPGPWIASCVGSGGSHDNPTDVYEVHNGYRRVAEYLSESDSRLIAAAPELLAALIRALPQIEFTHLYQQRTMTANEAAEIAATLTQARAVLAKEKP